MPHERSHAYPFPSLSANLLLRDGGLASEHVWMAMLDRPRPIDVCLASPWSRLTTLRSLEPSAARDPIACLPPTRLLPCMRDELSSKFADSGTDLQKRSLDAPGILRSIGESVRMQNSTVSWSHTHTLSPHSTPEAAPERYVPEIYS